MAGACGVDGDERGSRARSKRVVVDDDDDDDDDDLLNGQEPARALAPVAKAGRRSLRLKKPAAGGRKSRSKSKSRTKSRSRSRRKAARTRGSLLVWFETMTIDTKRGNGEEKGKKERKYSMEGSMARCTYHYLPTYRITPISSLFSCLLSVCARLDFLRRQLCIYL
ncbi:hypothetical protein LZ31DRAFT_245386 [Colletotrichum somersetense]|nr:hypothetical protein LZ31DRAFT_245386 [Colletotrichum somersetense]